MDGCRDCTSEWDEIANIAFVKHGDFYDLTVPGAEHYAAQGLWHHNSGKSVAGVVKTLERLRRSMSGIMCSPDLPHLKKSLWPEFRRWCPWDQVIPRQRRRGEPGWEPQQAFQLTFVNGAVLYVGGIDTPEAWEGPNVNFAYMDEARRAKDAGALKVLTGRIRIPGPNGEPPQIWFTTTTRMNWLFEYFGPIIEDDENQAFKESSKVVTLRTADNEVNLQEGYTSDRALALNSAEQLVYLEGEWGDLNDRDRFLGNMVWWDQCREPVPALTAGEPLVLACDAGVDSDSFALLGVSRHPDPKRKKTDVVVRYEGVWTPPRAGKIDFLPIEEEIRRLCREFHVVCIVYDPWQLHDMMTRLKRERLTWIEEFNQGAPRAESDKMLYDLIVQKRLVHTGQAELRRHIDHADAKRDPEGHKLRIVKRTQSLKIDLAVSCAMAAFQCLKLQL